MDKISKGEKPKKMEDYEIDSAMEDLLRAEKHKKNPALMKHIHKKLGAKKKQHVESIDDLKKLRNDMFLKKDEASEE